MGKIQQIKNKPSPSAYGQYYYDNDDLDNFQPLEESDSIAKPYDVFSDKSLHSDEVSNQLRDTIVTQRLRNVGVSGIKINDYGTDRNNWDNKNK